MKKPNSKTNAADTKVGTTGHSWDGIREFNNPLPRWWLWTFYATIIWGIAYMVVYPSTPLKETATQGVLGYDSRLALEDDLERYSSANAHLDAALVSTPIGDIKDNPELAHYATAGGAAVYQTFCSQCHGAGAAGTKGYPNLLDDDWLWGGAIADIEQTIRHGIGEEGNDETRLSEMPAHGEFLESDDIGAVTHYVLSLSGENHNPALVNIGKNVYADNCAACHGESGEGDREFGAPDLTDGIWLYGNSQKEVKDAITHGLAGVMPAWGDRLSESQIRQVTYYIHQLGGGE